MGLKDWWTYQQQPAFVRDDVLLLAEAREHARKVLEAKQKLMEKRYGRRR